MGLILARMNQLYPTIGQDNGRSVLRWDPAQLCKPECVIYEECPYVKKGKCSLEVNYMNNVFNNINRISDMFSDIEMQRFGLHLIPLYHQLIRMKKEAYSLKSVSTRSKQGVVAIHPIFGEMREIFRSISKEMRDLGIAEKWAKKFGRSTKMVDDIDIEDLLERGDPGFYEKISKEDEYEEERDREDEDDEGDDEEPEDDEPEGNGEKF